MSDIYMIRHGQASFSSENYDRLSTLGCLQSEILGESLSHMGIFFDAIYSGSLERQRHTAERVLERTPAGSSQASMNTTQRVSWKLRYRQ